MLTLRLPPLFSTIAPPLSAALPFVHRQLQPDGDAVADTGGKFIELVKRHGMK